jgi:predicted nucleic acid-binding protein
VIFVDTNVFMYAVGRRHPLQAQFPALDARDLCHLACCRRRQVTRIQTFNQALASVSS